MESFDKLIISLMDSEIMKGFFKREIGNILNVPLTCISDVWLETTLTNGIATQTIHVAFVDVEISKEDLMKLPFKSIYENTIIFEVGDNFL